VPDGSREYGVVVPKQAREFVNAKPERQVRIPDKIRRTGTTAYPLPECVSFWSEALLAGQS
jgi:hypothetical protein